MPLISLALRGVSPIVLVLPEETRGMMTRRAPVAKSDGVTLVSYVNADS